ncbi:gp16 family protein [Vibrio scophthalmi]|uniref:Putative phage regluatory protein n=1 Tax=Vibrio scophthalmi LMG 19158 TaxID=870967 RepID=F9RLR1_9VIBR|nr:regulatory protein GemA [Vibrio scophthalmi]EGU38819.1 putative phage regluatory protein [Vibrio scophthalmi LMG 19158]
MTCINKTRKQLIQLIHVGKSRLGMDEDTYRTMLTNIIGVSSAKDATWQQLEQVVTHMATLGFKPARSRQYSPKSGTARSRVTDAIRALWIVMFKQGFIEDGSEYALRVWIERTCGISSAQWLKDESASKVLESLKQWHKRVMVQRLAKPALKAESYREVCRQFELTGGAL